MGTEGTATGDAGSDEAAVGPVLMAGPVTTAIVTVIRNQHPDVQVTDRGSYLRVLVPGRCAIDRADVEAVLRRPFQLPGDLERVMTSFRGRFQVTADEASWTGTTKAPPSGFLGEDR
jgi:hypothetical protein